MLITPLANIPGRSPAMIAHYSRLSKDKECISSGELLLIRSGVSPTITKVLSQHLKKFTIYLKITVKVKSLNLMI